MTTLVTRTSASEPEACVLLHSLSLANHACGPVSREFSRTCFRRKDLLLLRQISRQDADVVVPTARRLGALAELSMLVFVVLAGRTF